MQDHSDKRTGLSFTAVIVNSTCHLYLQFYMSSFYIFSCQELCFLWIQTIYSYTYNSSIYSYSFCYNDCLVTWMVSRLTTAMLKPVIFFVLGFAFSGVANIWIFVILYDLCVLPAQFLYVIINIRYFESHVQLADPCATFNFSNYAGTLFCKRCNSTRWVSASNSQVRQAKVITDLMNILWTVRLMLALNRSILNKE
jgi:hypothetical protein